MWPPPARLWLSKAEAPDVPTNTTIAAAADAIIKRLAIIERLHVIYLATKDVTTTDNPGSIWVFENEGCHIDARQTAWRPGQPSADTERDGIVETACGSVMYASNAAKEVPYDIALAVPASSDTVLFASHPGPGRRTTLARSRPRERPTDRPQGRSGR